MRLLVVAAEEVRGSELREAIAQRAEDGPTEVRVVAPALTENVVDRVTGDVGDAIEAAERRLRRSLAEIRDAGVDADGDVGDADLVLAIRGALQTFEADEILIVADRENPPDKEPDGSTKAGINFKPPITHVYVTGEDDEQRITEKEHEEPGVPEEKPGEVTTRSRNLPPISPRDLAGITIAILGTIALFVLAAACGPGEHDQDGFDGCSVRVLLAGSFALINIAHVMGLTLFQASGYHGFFRRFFAWTSLYGTPAAIVVSILVG